MLKVAWVIGFSAAGYEVASRVYPSKGYTAVATGALVGALAGYLSMGVLPSEVLIGPAGGTIKPPEPGSATPQPGTTTAWGNPWGTTKVTPTSPPVTNPNATTPPVVQNPILPPVPQTPIFVTPPDGVNSAGQVPYSRAGSVLPMEGEKSVIYNTGTYGQGINQAYGDSWITNRAGLMIKNSVLSSKGYYINTSGYWVNFWDQTNFFFGNAPANPNTYQGAGGR